jgi:uncharacterized protein
MKLGTVLILSFVSLLLLGIVNYDYIRQQRARAFTGAAHKGDILTMRILLLCGAKVNEPAPGRGHAITAASATGQDDSVQVLLREGADINTREKLGWTPLMAAVRGGHIQTVRILLTEGADPNLSGDEGTALEIATRDRHSEIAVLLLQAIRKQ